MCCKTMNKTTIERDEQNIEYNNEQTRPSREISVLSLPKRLIRDVPVWFRRLLSRADK